ncbi:MAG TPA: DinB family protein, partial [Ktedonobacteraceae bacterium]|nr:DinB family protein [Ktedonobacteraceae bacterium]
DEGTLTLEELLSWLDRSQERIASALSKMDEASLAREYGSGDRKTTIGQRVFFLYFHETYHVGQTELFRQLAGKDDKLI